MPRRARRSVLLEARRGGCRGSPRARSRSASLLRPFFRRSRSPRPRRCGWSPWRCCARARFSWSPRKSPPARTRRLRASSSCSRCRFRAARFIWGASRARPAALLGAVFSAALLFWAPPLQVALWGLSLALEAALVAAAALFRHDAAQRGRRHRRRHGGPLSARPRHAGNPGARRHAARRRKTWAGMARARRGRRHRLRAAPCGRRDADQVAGLRGAALAEPARRWPRSRSTSSCRPLPGYSTSNAARRDARPRLDPSCSPQACRAGGMHAALGPPRLADEQLPPAPSARTLRLMAFGETQAAAAGHALPAGIRPGWAGPRALPLAARPDRLDPRGQYRCSPRRASMPNTGPCAPR